MDNKEFRKNAHEMVDWMADYLENIETFDVKSKVKPREIFDQLPESAPTEGESFDKIFADFKDIIIPGITHWQHPSFFAYFPANSSPPSILGEMLMSTIAAQCMIWDTSPSAAELEEKVMNWIKNMIGLPDEFIGVIQDTASTATICSLLTAREVKSSYIVNTEGLYSRDKFTIYCSSETHSSIEKGVKVIGLGKENLRKINVDDKFAMNFEELELEIKNDIENGYIPMAVVAATGTTGSTAIDSLEDIGKICKKYNVWLHVDAAFAGSALILPELRWMIKGIELADTFVFNPHKWLFTNFDCTAYYVKDQESLIKTFEILPEYLKTKSRGVNNYKDWGIPLGRRFRALKLWFVLRSYGIEGLKNIISNHLKFTKNLVDTIKEAENFEILAPVPLNTICFRYNPGNKSEEELNQLNDKILQTCNETGNLYLTHTKLNGKYTIRIVIGQTNVNQTHVDNAWEQIISSVGIQE